MIRHSVTIVRGCFGNCSFCAISRHQGPAVSWRSENSILHEIAKVVQMPDFRGTISDLGGPTANMYGLSCEIQGCPRHDCLQKGICRHLHVDENPLLNLLRNVQKIKKVKNVFVSSGLRMELLLKTPKLLAEILDTHTPGAMKIAPEHTEENVLRLMHKQAEDVLPRFLEICRDLGRRKGKRYFFTPYFISAHPGCTLDDMTSLAGKVRKLGLKVKQFQDFTPTPGTLSTAMFVSGLDRDTLKPIHVACNDADRRKQRQVLESVMARKQHKNKKGK
jgi:uncharacterized radical SAM protein YgiQ